MVERLLTLTLASPPTTCRQWDEANNNLDPGLYTMPGPTTEILSEDLKDLRAEVHTVDTRLAGLAAQFGFAKWLLGLSLGASLSGIGFGIWWAGNINANVANLEKRFDKFEVQVESRFDRLETKMESRFDRLEASIAKVIEQTSPAPKK